MNYTKRLFLALMLCSGTMFGMEPSAGRKRPAGIPLDVLEKAISTAQERVKKRMIRDTLLLHLFDDVKKDIKDTRMRDALRQTGLYRESSVQLMVEYVKGIAKDPRATSGKRARELVMEQAREELAQCPPPQEKFTLVATAVATMAGMAELQAGRR